MPIGPETTCIGPALSSRHAPTVMLVHAAAPCREQRRVPAEQPLLGQRLGVVLRGVEHHLDDALNVAVRRRQRADIHAETPGDGGAHLIPVEDFALDLAGLEHVLGQGLEHGLRAKAKSERFHAPDQPPLPVADGGKRLRQHLVIPAEIRPVLQFMDISCHNLRTSCGDYASYSPQAARIFSANHAVNKTPILRIGGFPPGLRPFLPFIERPAESILLTGDDRG